MKLGWLLGAAADRAAGADAAASSPSRSSTPIRSRSASRPAIRCPTASCCGRASRRSRSRAAACRWRSSRSTGRLRATRGSRAIAQKGIALARPELGHSVHVEVGGLEPGREYWYRFRAGDEISQIGRTKTAPPAGRRGRSPAVCRLRLQSLRDRLLHRVPPDRRRAVRLRVPHRRLHLRRPRGRRTQRSSSASTTARKSTRSSTIETATRSTSPIAISWRRTPRRRGS